MNSESSAVRWLVLGTFTTTPTEGKFCASDIGVNAALKALAPNVSVSYGTPDSPEPDGSCEIAISKIRSFTLAGVTSSALVSWQELLDDLNAGACSEQEAHQRVSDLAGASSALTQRVAKIVAPAPAAPSEKAGSDVVDAIFGQVAASPTPGQPATAKAAVGAFIASNKKSAGRQQKPRGPLKKVCYAVEEALHGMATAILADPTLASLESNWRGLKFVVDQCPTGSGMRVDCVDVAADGVASTLRALEDSESSDLPDAIFLCAAVSHESLDELAQLAEALQVPFVVTVAPVAFGVETQDDVVDALETPYGGLPPTWPSLVAQEHTRWLAVAVNKVVLLCEGAGSAQRIVLGSPVFGVAAMLSSSFQRVGDFSSIYGKAGSLRAPAARQLTSGRYQGVSIPTESFFSASTQSKLAAFGVLGLGSGRNSDLLTLNNAPTLRSCQSALPLQSQLLAGRVVRFAQWARDQVPADSTDEDVAALFQEAAHVFLFRGVTEGIVFQAEVEGEAQERKINIGVDMGRAPGKSRFQMAFSLPLRP